LRPYRDPSLDEEKPPQREREKNTRSQLHIKPAPLTYKPVLKSQIEPTDFEKQQQRMMELKKINE
jgi:protein tyrosine phosphatase (PTP) superfamily phosphohydrolase (DUF442 family)